MQYGKINRKSQGLEIPPATANPHGSISTGRCYIPTAGQHKRLKKSQLPAGQSEESIPSAGQWQRIHAYFWVLAGNQCPLLVTSSQCPLLVTSREDRSFAGQENAINAFLSWTLERECVRTLWMGGPSWGRGDRILIVGTGSVSWLRTKEEGRRDP